MPAPTIEPRKPLPAPIRDDQALGPTEDLQREPDGIPHVLIGAGIVMMLLLAAVVLVVLSGHASKAAGAALVLAVGIPALAGLTLLVARRWRKPDQPHPSR